MGFGKLLNEKMIEKKIKQSQLAQALNIPKTTLSSIINRDNTKIEIDLFLQICEYLGCDPNEFSSEVKPVSKSKNAAIDYQERKILDILDNLNEDGKNALVSYAEFISNDIRYKKGNENISENA